MKKMYGDNASGKPVPVADDPYAELFADCTSPEDVLQLQKDIERAESS